MSADSGSTNTELAVDRTRLAHDRTLLAWIRTATSLISFGFTIYKFFQYLKDKGELRTDRLFGPREFAMFLIATGLVSLLIETVQNRRDMKVMRERYTRVPYSLATLIAALVAVLGILSFLAVLFRQ